MVKVWRSDWILDVLLSVAFMGGDLETLQAVALALGLGPAFQARVKRSVDKV